MCQKCQTHAATQTVAKDNGELEMLNELSPFCMFFKNLFVEYAYGTLTM